MSQKPYQIDLNSFPATNDQKTVIFNKATKTFSINGDAEEWKGIGIWPNGGIDISDYNIARIKRKFVFATYRNNEKRKSIGQNV